MVVTPVLTIVVLVEPRGYGCHPRLVLRFVSIREALSDIGLLLGRELVVNPSEDSSDVSLIEDRWVVIDGSSVQRDWHSNRLNDVGRPVEASLFRSLEAGEEEVAVAWISVLGWMIVKFPGQVNHVLSCESGSGKIEGDESLHSVSVG